MVVVRLKMSSLSVCYDYPSVPFCVGDDLTWVTGWKVRKMSGACGLKLLGNLSLFSLTFSFL